MIKRKQIFVVLLGLLCAGLAFGAGQSEAGADTAKPVTIRVAHDNAVTAPGHLAFLEFKKLVEARSSGRINVTLFPGGQMGSVADTFEMVRRGDLEMSVAATTLLTQTIPEFAVWDLFYLFDDAAHAHRVLDGDAGKRLLEALDRLGLQGLGYMEIGFRNFSNSRRPINTLADLQGLKIRGYSPMQIKAWSSVGTNLTSLSWAEVFTSLQQNLIDGQECATSSFFDARFYEAQKYWSLTGHIYTNWMWYANKNFISGLSKADQELVIAAAKETIAIQRRLSQEAENAAIDKIRVAGVLVNAVNVEAKRAMGEVMNTAVKEDIVSRSGQEMYNYVMNAVKASRN
jgi:tripartite ATP-independent transporter DctP family solute receptor